MSALKPLGHTPLNALTPSYQHTVPPHASGRTRAAQQTARHARAGATPTRGCAYPRCAPRFPPGHALTSRLRPRGQRRATRLAAHGERASLQLYATHLRHAARQQASMPLQGRPAALRTALLIQHAGTTLPPAPRHATARGTARAARPHAQPLCLRMSPSAASRAL